MLLSESYLENYSKIEKENRLLLQKISDIIDRKENKFLKNSSRKKKRSLNHSFRKKQLEKINKENRRILERIQTSHSMYDQRDWVRASMKQEKLVRSICEYDYILDKSARKQSNNPIGKQEGGLLVARLDTESTFESARS